MKSLSFKEFMTALKARIDRYTLGELKEIILAQGKDLAPRERARYLDGIVPPENGNKRTARKKKGGNEDAELLLKEIESFGRRVENHEFTNGWGWDEVYGDERAWGDDSWVAEINDLFERINGLYENGDHRTARDAYASLLDIYRRGLEEAGFSGYEHDEMIGTDLNKATSRYFRCVYLTEELSGRPQALWNAISNFSDDTADVNFQGLIDIDTEGLPQLDDFGRLWLEFLKKQKADSLSAGLVKEAVRMFQGTKGLENLALEEGLKIPSAYIEWLEALKKEGKYEEMIRAALQGLERLPGRLRIRARIADFLLEAAVRRKQKPLIERSLKEALRADPSLDRLMDALDHAGTGENRKVIINETLGLLEALRKEKSRIRTWEDDRSPDFREKDAPGNLDIQCHLLKGDYEKAAALTEKSKPLGWSSGEDPAALGVPFFLMAHWNEAKTLTANISALWNEATAHALEFSYDHVESDEDENRRERRNLEKTDSRFRHSLEQFLKETPIPPADVERYFNLAKRKAIERIDAIVGKKFRNSYWKAAELLLAVAEVYWSNDRKGDGQALIDRVCDQYRRHSAFRSELRTLANKTGVFTLS